MKLNDEIMINWSDFSHKSQWRFEEANWRNYAIGNKNLTNWISQLNVKGSLQIINYFIFQQNTN